MVFVGKYAERGYGRLPGGRRAQGVRELLHASSNVLGFELAHRQVDGGTCLRRASEAKSYVPREAVISPEWRAGRDVPVEQRGAVEERVDHEARAERMADDDPFGYGPVFLL